MTDLAIVESTPKALAVMTPSEKLERAREYAVALNGIIKFSPDRFVAKIGNNDFPKAEVWQTIAWMDGSEAHTVWARAVYGNDGDRGVTGFEARAEVHDIATGKFLASGESFYGMDESATQGQRSQGGKLNAAKSAAQTRAISKALRGRYAFVVILAGLDATPAEEIDRSTGEIRPAKSKQPRRPQQKQTDSENIDAERVDAMVEYAVENLGFGNAESVVGFLGKETLDGIKTQDDLKAATATLQAEYEAMAKAEANLD
jgi:hypothetical protein